MNIFLKAFSNFIQIILLVFLFILNISCANLKKDNNLKYYDRYKTPAITYSYKKGFLFIYNNFLDGTIKLDLRIKYDNEKINLIKFIEAKNTIKIKIDISPFCIIFDELLMYDYDNDYYNFGEVCFK